MIQKLAEFENCRSEQIVTVDDAVVSNIVKDYHFLKGRRLKFSWTHATTTPFGVSCVRKRGFLTRAARYCLVSYQQFKYMG